LDVHVVRPARFFSADDHFSFHLVRMFSSTGGGREKKIHMVVGVGRPATWKLSGAETADGGGPRFFSRASHFHSREGTFSCVLGGGGGGGGGIIPPGADG